MMILDRSGTLNHRRHPEEAATRPSRRTTGACSAKVDAGFAIGTRANLGFLAAHPSRLAALAPPATTAKPLRRDDGFEIATDLIQRNWIRLPASALLADRVLGGLHLHFCGRERRRRRAALLEVLVGLRFLLFLVAAHLTLCHDGSPGARLREVALANNSKCAGVCN